MDWLLSKIKYRVLRVVPSLTIYFSSEEYNETCLAKGAKSHYEFLAKVAILIGGKAVKV